MGSLLLLIPLLMWLLCPKTPDCNEGMIEFWPQAKKGYCCMTVGRGCITTTRFTTVLPETTPTVAPTPFPTPPPTPPPSPPPPTPPPAPPGPVDPFNCAVDAWVNWAADKKEWCCRNHHICDGTPTARRLVGGQEGLVLHQCWKRLRDAEWRLCLMRLSKIYLGMQGRWRMRAIFGCFWLLVLKSIVRFNIGGSAGSSSAGVRAIFRRSLFSLW